MNLLEIVQTVALRIKGRSYIHAMWLEGSYATGEYNEQSDIDVWLDVNEGKFDECIEVFRQVLNSITEIEKETTRGVYSDAPKLMKQTFYLKGFPPGQVVELDMQEHSRKFKFSKKEHTIKILFDKDNTIQWRD